MRHSPDAALTLAMVELWQRGFSAREIADLFSRERHEPFTRNAVIGRIFRARKLSDLEIRGRAAKVNGKKRARKAKPRPQTPSKLAKILPPAPRASSPGAPLRFVALALPSGFALAWHAVDGCAFIANDDLRAPAWCNAPGFPWCAFHEQKMRTKREG